MSIPIDSKLRSIIGLGFGVSGRLASSAIFLENQSRLTELNLYCGVQVVSGLLSYLELYKSWAPLTVLTETHDIALNGYFETILRRIF